jgi:tripartite-type tricarboxylate transporter receptor subunit TctC
MKYIKNFTTFIVSIFCSSVIAATPVTVLIPFSPGGPTDRLWRAIEEPINKELVTSNIKLVTEYAQGAGGLVAINRLKSSKDNTVLGFFSSSIAINSNLNINSNYNHSNFLFVAFAGNNNMEVVSRFKNFEEFSKFCKSNSITYASAGIGSATHLLAEVLVDTAKCINTVHVPYKGVAQIIPDAITNRIDVFINYQQEVPYGGNLTTFALTSDTSVWHVLVANTSADTTTVDKIKAALDKVKNNKRITTEIENNAKVSGLFSNKSSRWFLEEFEKYKLLINKLNLATQN